MKKYTLLFITLSIVCFSLSAQKKYQSLLWEISGNGLDKPSYLYGTMHVSSKLAFHLGDSFFMALKNVDMVALEIHPETWVDDMLAFDPYAFWQGGGGGYYGRSRELGKAEKRKKAIMEALRKDPSLINYYLFRSQGYSGNFEEDTYLDLYIFQAGKKLGKKTGGLEQMSELMLNLEEAERAREEEYKYKKRTRDYYDESVSFSDALEDAYRRGDLDAIDSLNIADGTPGYLEYMLYKRNQVMADRMDSIIKNADLRLFAGMGASHLPGEQGVIEMLRKKGYTLRAMNQGERAPKEKRKIDDMIIEKDFNNETSFDNYFDVNLPGKMYELPGVGSTRSYFHPDMANGAYYTITRIKTFARELEQTTDYVLKSVDSLLYENIPGKILSQEKTKHQGFDGYSITTRTRRGAIQRFEIFITPEEIFVFKLGGNGEFANTKEANKFFKSINLKIPKETNWQTFTTPDKTFSALMPHPPLFYGDTSILGVYFNPEPFTAIDFNNGNVYSITKESLYTSNIATVPDSLMLEQAIFDFSDSKYYDELERKDFKKGDLRIVDARYSIDENFNMQVRYVLRKGYLFILSAKYKNDSADADRFVQSLSFTAPPEVTYEEFNDTLLHFTVKTTPQKNALEKLLRKVSRYKARDKAHKTLNETKVFMESPKSNELVSVEYTRFGKYIRFKDSAEYWDSYFDRLNKDSSLIILDKKTYQKNGFMVADISYTDTGCSFAVKERKMLRNAVMYELQTVYETKNGLGEFTKTFFETFTPKDTIIGQNMFSGNVKLIVNDLVNGDSATHAESFESLRYIRLTDEDFKLWTTVIDTLQPENEDYFDYKSRLIKELWDIKNPETINYLSKLFYKAGDTSSFQLAVLKSLLNIETAQSYNTFKELVLDETPLGKTYDINSLFWSMDDSLELAATLYPDLFGLFLLEEYREKMVGVLATLVDSNKISTNTYKSFLSTLKIEAKNELKRKKANKLEESSNSYSSNSYRSINGGYSYYYGSYLTDLATVLIPFYKEKNIAPYFDKLLKYDDNGVRIPIALKLLKKGHKVPETLWTDIAKNRGWRSTLYNALEKEDKLSLFPKEYISQDSITIAMVATNVGSSYEKLDTIALVSKRLVEVDGKKGYVYLYKYKMQDSKVWFLAMAGMQPKNKKEINTETDFFNTNTGQKINDEISVEKQFSLLIKEAKLGKAFSKLGYSYGGYGEDSYDSEYEDYSY
jgi:uncharacterized protein YbaP (TraB family)